MGEVNSIRRRTITIIAIQVSAVEPLRAQLSVGSLLLGSVQVGCQVGNPRAIHSQVHRLAKDPLTDYPLTAS